MGRLANYRAIFRIALQFFYHSLRPIYPHPIPRLQPRRRIARAHHRRNAQFAGNNGGVGERRAHISDNRPRLGEKGRPANVGGCRYQDFARLQQVAFLRRIQAAYHPLHHARRAGKAGDGVGADRQTRRVLETLRVF